MARKVRTQIIHDKPIQNLNKLIVNIEKIIINKILIISFLFNLKNNLKKLNKNIVINGNTKISFTIKELE